MKLNTSALKRSSIGLVALAVAALPVAASAADDTANTVINASIGSTISVSSTSPVSISLTPGGSAVVSSASDTVSVSTNNSAGYTLTLADADADTDLVSGTDTIEAHDGTVVSPTALANNTWGFAVAGLGSFDGSYTAESNNDSSTSKWAGVPASGSPATIKTTASTAASETTTVWYAVKVDSSQPTGNYTDTVTYTATTN
jgi:hypothetical protein